MALDIAGAVTKMIQFNERSARKNQKKRVRLIGLRGKLLLATLTLLILPIAGLSYLKELELFLKHNHSQSVIVIAKTIASVFRDNSSLITLNHLTQSLRQPIYCHSLVNKKIIDGYSDDWFALQNRQTYFSSTINSPNHFKDKLSLLCAVDEQFYYFLVSVNRVSDDEITALGQVDFINKQKINSINFQYMDYAHRVQNYDFRLNTPGWIDGELNSPLSVGSKKQIPAQWQESNQLLTLEFKIPIGRINQYMAFYFQQITQTNKQYNDEVATMIDTVSLNEILASTEQLNPIVLTDPLNVIKLEQLIPKNTRLWLLNKDQYINAKSVNEFHTENLSHDFSLLALYRKLYLILMDYPEQQSFYGSNQVQINNQAIQLTLKGQSSAEWLDNPQSSKMVLSVTTPVYGNESEIIGTLVLEQNNETLLALQDKTFERILLLTLIIFLSIALILILLSTRLLRRIINLRDDTNQALSNDGVISNKLYRNDNDEIGDLARSFSTLLSRIDQNNQYLRSLSGKLSHELRTPLTIIKSSLENMDVTDLSDDNKKFTLRANEGCIRLANLLNRMSEASRLEQSIGSIEKESIEMVSFLEHYIESLRAVNSELEISFQTSLTHLETLIAPELIAQLLDKIFSNAISFHQANTPIRLTMTVNENEMMIELNNHGRLIDKNKLNSIFSSLTSYRTSYRTSKTHEAHLGLGLYICRLIANFHHGELNAYNNEDNQSVSFILKIPLLNQVT